VLEEPPCLGKQDIRWIRATHVFRHWCQVALRDSSLWAGISGIPTNANWVSEFLAPAKNLPLDIDIDLVWKPSQENISLLPLHLSRTRELRLRGLSTLVDTDSIGDNYSLEAPNLEHFELDSL
jgi:hypothetical protein